MTTATRASFNALEFEGFKTFDFDRIRVIPYLVELHQDWIVFMKPVATSRAAPKGEAQ